MTGSSRGPDGDRSAMLQPSEVSGKRGKGPRRREFHLRHFELQGLFHILLSLGMRFKNFN